MNLIRMMRGSCNPKGEDIVLIDKNTDENIDDSLCKNDLTTDIHKKHVPIITEHYNNAILRFFLENSTIIEVALTVSLFTFANLEILMGVNLMHGAIMRVLMLAIMILSHLILRENITERSQEAFAIRVKEKAS